MATGYDVIVGFHSKTVILGPLVADDHGQVNGTFTVPKHVSVGPTTWSCSGRVTRAFPGS